MLTGWISPLNHASYPGHSFGYDKLPTIFQSSVLFLVLLAVLGLLSCRALKRYNFTFIGVLSMDSKRMMGRRTIWLAVFLAVAGLVAGTKFPAFDSPFPGGSWYGMVAEALTSKTVIFLVPVVAVLPYGDVWIGEKASGFLGFYVARKGKKDFVEDRVITTTCSGCFGWALAVLITLLLYFVLSFPWS